MRRGAGRLAVIGFNREFSTIGAALTSVDMPSVLSRLIGG
jgi:hypothetical protein